MHPLNFFLLGCMPNITRNAIVNCAELVTYDIIKELILKYDLMTGKVRGNILSVKLGPTGEWKNPPECAMSFGSHQTTCPATSPPPSAQASAQRWWPRPWMWSRHGSWTQDLASTAAPSTVLSPCWEAKEPQPSIKGKMHVTFIVVATTRARKNKRTVCSITDLS